MDLRGGMMITEKKSVVIEIPEDAYRQNTICTAWPVIKASETGESPDTQPPSNDNRQLGTES